jgi:Protein of unknown function (DUF2892)
MPDSFSGHMEMTMIKNVGSTDRIIRIVLGLVLLAFALFSGSAYAWLGYIGVVPLVTAAMSSCPIYSMLGMSTCPVKRA